MDDIWTYSEEKWDEAQADRYLRGLFDEVADPEKRRLLGKPLPFVKPGVKRFRYIRHYIYFYERADHIYVERVLHDSMDQTLHIV